MRFALVHEVLFTSSQGCMSALVRAHCGEREAAVADLKAWAQEASRDVFARHSALDGLYQLEEFEAANVLGLGVFDEAAEQGKWGLADSVAHLLGHLVQKIGGDGEFRAQVRSRLERANAHTGGHH